MTFKCELDPKLTEKDLPFFIPDIQGTWGSACGRNRGVFVVYPPDGHTYGAVGCVGNFCYVFFCYSRSVVVVVVVVILRLSDSSWSCFVEGISEGFFGNVGYARGQLANRGVCVYVFVHCHGRTKI